MQKCNHAYAPSYYNDFKCKADKCLHSCCIDWEITLDPKTVEKYEKFRNIADTVTECDGEFCFKLTDDGRCPHLNKSGLCDIIISHGEGLLSDICKRHPRFFNEVFGGITEIGIGIVCEEACRLVLENGEPFSLIAVSCDGKDGDSSPSSAPFNPLPLRDRIIKAAEAKGKSFGEKLSFIKEAFEIPELYSLDEWRERFLELEILDEGWELMLKSAKDKPDGARSDSFEYDKYYARLLIYFVYRHVSVAASYDNFRARLAFSILSVEMIRHLFKKGELSSVGALSELARSYSSEIEYSEDNTAELIFEFESVL